MTLDSAHVVRQNLNDTEDEYVQFDFGYPVNRILSPTGFSLEGYSSNASAHSISAQIIQGNDGAVLAGYQPGTNVKGFTLATVNAGAVQDESQKVNMPDSVPLSGNYDVSAATDGPQLVSVVANPTLEQIQFNFDRQVNKIDANASDFGFYTMDGTAHDGTSVVTEDNNTVTVKFANDVEHAVAYFADSGSVDGARGIGNLPTSIGTTKTTAPHLAAVSSLIGNTQFDFTFSEPVENVQPSKFHVYTPDGTSYTASGFVQPSPDVIQAAFPSIQKFGHTVSLASVNQDAVQASDGSATPSTVGDLQVAGSDQATAGHTSGPDLVSASVDNATGQMRLTFDKVIDDDTMYQPSNFSVITDAGAIVPARSFVEVDGDSVVVNFPRNAAEAAHTVTVSHGAVKDFQGDVNQAATVSY